MTESARSPLEVDLPTVAGATVTTPKVVPLSRRCHDCYEFGHEECGCGECGAAYCGLKVGAQVVFAENDEHTTSLGVVSRVWPNGKYVTVVSDGRMFVRLIGRVRLCL